MCFGEKRGLCSGISAELFYIRALFFERRLGHLFFLIDTIMATSPPFTGGLKALTKQLYMWPLTCKIGWVKSKTFSCFASVN